MTDKGLTLKCPRCNATLAVPGRPKRDTVVQCSECGHRGRLPKKNRGKGRTPIVLKPATSADAAPDPTLAADRPPDAVRARPSRRRTLQKITMLLGVFGLIAVGVWQFSPGGSDPVNPPDDATAVSDSSSVSSVSVAAEESELDDDGAVAEASGVARELITNEEMFRRIRHDLETEVSRFETLFTRYFTLSHLHSAGVSDAQLETCRHSLIKLLNSLSWERELYLPVAIDDDRTIYRIDLRDLKWTPETWTMIVRHDPYAFSYTNENAATCADLTEESNPATRADWFVFAAARPPLYHDILEIPHTLDEMASQLRVRMAENIREAETIRAGFHESAETTSNRVIERHRTPYGALWVSYNFRDNDHRRNVFDYPLGPGDGPEEFAHDGAQAIFNLPNGLQAYMIVDQSGRRVDQGAADTFRDSAHSREPVNGVSCMACHASGIIAKVDEVGIAVRTNREAYDAPDYILELYADSNAMNELQREDQNRFLEAAAKLQLPVTSHDEEPIFVTAQKFEADLTIGVVAAELGITVDELQSQLASNTSLASSLGGLSAERASIRREDFLAKFGLIGETLGLGRSIRKQSVVADDRTRSSTAGTNDLAGVQTESAAAAFRPPPATKTSASDTASAGKPDTKAQPRNVFGDGGATFVSFDGKRVTFRDKAGTEQSVAIDSLSASDQETVLSQNVNASGSANDLPGGAAPSPPTASDQTRRPDALITSGQAKLISFDGRQNVKIQHTDGRSETILIDTLNSADVEFILKQDIAAPELKDSSADDLPGATGDEPAPADGAPEPLSQVGDGHHVWHGKDGQPLVEGLLHSFEPRRELVRIEPAVRIWKISGETLEGTFHVASTSPDGVVEVQVRPVGGIQSRKFPLESLGAADRAYMDLIRRGLESTQIQEVRSFKLRYWQVPIDNLSPADQQRALSESGIERQPR